MSRQVSRGSAGEDRQMSRHVSRLSAGEDQADEQAGCILAELGDRARSRGTVGWEGSEH